MRFNLVDQIVDLVPNRSITTVKNLTMGEEYLAEHFPTFPVMPGVLMIESIVQSSAWLIRVTESFKHTVVVLKEAKNVKYGQFVAPGHQLKLTCELLDSDDSSVILKAKGEVEGKSSVSAKVILSRFNLADVHPIHRRDDQRLRVHLIKTFQMLATPELRIKLREEHKFDPNVLSGQSVTGSVA